MSEQIAVDWLINNSFAIGVCIYLLYERTKFNQEISKVLERIVAFLDIMEKRIQK